MKKSLIILTLMVGISANAGNLLLPQERLAIPKVTGSHLICIWDESAQSWHDVFQPYDHSGSVNFQFPALGRWYWIGLWDEKAGEYAFGKWVGHFASE